MLNAQGDIKDCSSAGGGIGLGMLLGMAIAATSNQLCESEWEEKGYLFFEDIGTTGLVLPEQDKAKPTVLYAEQPAALCVVRGDTLLSVDNKKVDNTKEARKALFKPKGEELNLLLQRKEEQKECLISLE
jgi:S1-C subfamily serine protease